MVCARRKEEVEDWRVGALFSVEERKREGKPRVAKEKEKGVTGRRVLEGKAPG